MTTPDQPDPAAQLRAAAARLRGGDWRIDQTLTEPIAAWLERAAREQDATQQAAQANWRGSDDTEARDRWIAKMTGHEALSVARALLGGQP